MRPLDHKLKYQIDKLLRTAVTGSLGKTRFLLVVMDASTSHLILAHVSMKDINDNVFRLQLRMIHCSYALILKISSAK